MGSGQVGESFQVYLRGAATVRAGNLESHMPGHSILRGYGFAWVTLGFFFVTLVGHWVFGWFAFVDEQLAHGQPAEVSPYLNEMMRDTLENWQSEFLQLVWQVAGLAMLLYVGSPQSKEGDDRMEAKLDEILRRIEPGEAERLIADLDERYGGRHTDKPFAHLPGGKQVV